MLFRATKHDGIARRVSVWEPALRARPVVRRHRGGGRGLRGSKQGEGKEQGWGVGGGGGCQRRGPVMEEGPSTDSNVETIQ